MVKKCQKETQCSLFSPQLSWLWPKWRTKTELLDFIAVSFCSAVCVFVFSSFKPPYYTKRCYHICSEMKMKLASASSSTHSNCLNLVILLLLREQTNYASLHNQGTGNHRKGIRRRTEGDGCGAVNLVNGYECLSLCVFTAVISA